MRYLFDTNAFSDLMRVHPNVVARLAKIVFPDQVRICPIVRGEILFGIEKLPPGRRRESIAEAAVRLFPGFPCEPITSPVGDTFSRLKLACQLIGVAASDNDLWIAATADFLQATVVTRDSDLGRIPGVRREDWTK